MNKLLKFGIIGIAGFFAVSFISSKTQKAFAGARNQLPIRLYRGRSNYRGTKQEQQGGYQLSGNKNQRILNRKAITTARRAGRGTVGQKYYTRNGIPVNPNEQRTINDILTRQRRERGWT